VKETEMAVLVPVKLTLAPPEGDHWVTKPEIGEVRVEGIESVYSGPPNKLIDNLLGRVKVWNSSTE